MVQRVNAPKLAPPTKSGPSQRIVAIWKGTTRTKQPGELEPGVYALFDIAFWVASNLDSITSLSDPHPALRSVRTELDHLADRLTRKLGVKSVRVTDITVEVHARGYKLRAALNSARALSGDVGRPPGHAYRRPWCRRGQLRAQAIVEHLPHGDDGSRNVLLEGEPEGEGVNA
jgi:hypothetical protein